MQGISLYYRVLESMLKGEQDRTGRANFGSLLSSASFHKCLAACAFEVVIASYRMVRAPFRPGLPILPRNALLLTHKNNTAAPLRTLLCFYRIPCHLCCNANCCMSYSLSLSNRLS